MIRAMQIKRREVGPGKCSLKELLDEGWSLEDLKRFGYESADFLDAGVGIVTLLKRNLFTLCQLRADGITLQEFVDAGWDGTDGRLAGFSFSELLAAGCNVQRIRNAGYTDVTIALQLRRL